VAFIPQLSEGYYPTRLLSAKPYLKLGDTTVKVKKVTHAIQVSPQPVGGSSYEVHIKIRGTMLTLRKKDLRDGQIKKHRQ
jgi:hypothetical protein